MAHALLLFLLFPYIISTNIHACKQTERNSLLSFASTLSSPPLNWTSIDCCRWKGITCDQDGWVTRLLLPSKGLKGGISPSSLANLTHLTHLNLSHNSLLGSLETQFFLHLNRLEILDLSYNRLSGELPLSLPSSNIHIVDLSSNHFFGAIPSSFFQQASNLTSFNVSNNTFTGSLKAIGLSKNHLEGQIQAEILSLKSLSFLVLGGSRFTNLTWAMKILMSFKSLHTLSLAGSYEGEGMPYDDDMVDFDGFQNLRLFSLAGSDLTGQIPAWFSKLKNLEFLELSFNQITGPIPMIVLSNNNISGDIPTEIGQLQFLQELYLDSNNFSDVIPDQISNLKNLEVLNLSMNLLSGIIPSSLVSLNFLREFNASYNNLEGPIPTGTQLQSFNASAFEGNPKLCGVPHPNKCEPNKGIDADKKNNKDEGNGHHQLPWFYIFAVLGFIVGFWGVCGSLVINNTWRYAYFRFIDNVQDRLYVMVTVRINTMKRRLRG
ncbi:tyrosine-sulfated glycopeptide receptor 1-like [Prunus avium]|uniref:Tyrosine-sulfated glycopeptide receptor 1-like n=1 Tax=Prunus avium TaxID=42229 RepID=A0A6P5TXQ5_PRUAV|nr:tyrosine-sulfated glycopeptide receptor 1-like [Prunus avium]